MAEAFLNDLYEDTYEGYSAGTEPTEINPYVVKAMAEVGIDISEKRSKWIDKYRGERFDFVVTVCDHAKETCPFFPGSTILHKSFQDPSEFKGTEDEILKQIRRVRDEIKVWLEETFSSHVTVNDS
jgi:arsenate reductase